MKPENRQKLETFRHYQINRGGSGQDLNEVVRIIHEEWDPWYRIDLSCPACLMTLIDYAFGKMDNEKVDNITVDFENNFPNNINS